MIVFLSIGILVYLINKLFIEEEESKIDVPKYERPRYEKYLYRSEDDRP